jgi:hypothetical protein
MRTKVVGLFVQVVVENSLRCVSEGLLRKHAYGVHANDHLQAKSL